MSLDRLLELIVIQFLPALGFLLALILLFHLLRSRRSPAATFAWLIAIIFVPYLGVPFYLLFGGRKMKKMTKLKGDLIETLSSKTSHQTAHEVEEVFPFREDNHVEVLPKGTHAYSALMEQIQKAQKSIYVTTYVLETETVGLEILNAFTEKAKSGLEVCLLLDGVGSMQVKKKHLDSFKKAGGQHAFFMPMLHLPFRGRANLRNHRKMILFDRRHAIVGGRNLADEYMGPKSDPKRWKDLSLSIEGSTVRDLFAVFYSDWKFASGQTLAPWQDTEAQMASGDLTSIQLIPSGPDVSGDYLQEAIIEALFAAKKRIWIVTPYFVPNEMLTQALSMAARRGVDVRICIPKHSNHLLPDLVRRTYLHELQKKGVRVLKYKPTMLHAKLLILDEDLALTGSANMDLRSLFLNYEVGFFLKSKEQVKILSDWIVELSKDCEEEQESVNMVEEVIEGMGRLLAPLL